MDRSRQQQATGQGNTSGGHLFRITPVTLSLGIYCFLLLSRLLDASVLTRDNEYFSVIVLQIMIFLIPAFAYIRWRGEEFRRRLRARLPRMTICSCFWALSLR